MAAIKNVKSFRKFSFFFNFKSDLPWKRDSVKDINKIDKFKSKSIQSKCHFFDK